MKSINHNNNNNHNDNKHDITKEQYGSKNKNKGE